VIEDRREVWKKRICLRLLLNVLDLEPWTLCMLARYYQSWGWGDGSDGKVPV
ncbi:hypothetical protein STEG23_028629, partial [Scotinomys teguina]